MNKNARTVWITTKTVSRTVWTHLAVRIQFVKIQNIVQALQKFPTHKKPKGESSFYHYVTVT